MCKGGGYGLGGGVDGDGCVYYRDMRGKKVSFGR